MCAFFHLTVETINCHKRMDICLKLQVSWSMYKLNMKNKNELYMCMGTAIMWLINYIHRKFEMKFDIS